MKKNILFILPNLPWPLDSGGNQAMYNGILAAKNIFNVYITYPVYNKQGLNNTSPFFNEKNPNITTLPILVVKKSFSRYLMISHYYHSIVKRLFQDDKDYILDSLCNIESPNPLFIDAVNRYIKEFNIHIVQVEMNGMINIVYALPANIKKLFVHHELKFVRAQLTLNNISADSSYFVKTSIQKRIEVSTLNEYDGIIVLSKTDREKLEGAGVKKPVFESFAIVNTTTTGCEYMQDSYDSYTLSFVGTESHRPNYIGLMWFVDKCLPVLLSKDSKYKLKVIGKWSQKTKDKLKQQYPCISFTGFVDNLQEELVNTIMIVPITIGSGIRMKILEAGSIGIPVVSTLVGAEGLPLVNGENAYLSKEPEDFVNSILKLKDSSIRRKFALNLKEIVERNYSLTSLCNNRQKIYDSLDI